MEWFRWYHGSVCEPRKIILVITDGDPDDKEAAREAIRTASIFGLEVYGIGIQTQSILNLLSDKHCRVIASINELAPAMFGMLHNALIG